MSEHAYDGAWPQSEPSPGDPPCAGSSETERLALIDGLKAQIRNGVYRPDIRDLARSLANMIVREL